MAAINLRDFRNLMLGKGRDEGDHLAMMQEDAGERLHHILLLAHHLPHQPGHRRCDWLYEGGRKET